MIENSNVRIYADDIQPDPGSNLLWMDLASDPYGSIIKIYDGSDWVDLISSSGVGIGEAPNDGKQYARQNKAWSVVKSDESEIDDSKTTTDKTWSSSKISNEIQKSAPLYTNENQSVVSVGGIPAGTTFSNKTMEEVFNMMMYPELFPTTLENPSYYFYINGTSSIMEVGSTISIVATDYPDRGSISPKYQSSSECRSGEFTSIIWTSSNTTPYVIKYGQNQWSRSAHYAAGVQPKGSNGTPYNSPIAAGDIVYTYGINGVYATYATTSTSKTYTKQPLKATNSQLEVSLVANTDGGEQGIRIPYVYNALSKIEQYNDLSGKYEQIDINSFPSTDIVVGGINYKQYTYNGSSIGLRKLRFTF